MNEQQKKGITDFIENSIHKRSLLKIVLGKRFDKQSGIINITFRLVIIQNKLMASMVLKSKDKVLTKNIDVENLSRMVLEYLGNSFYQADIFTTTENMFVITYKNQKAKISTKLLRTETQDDINFNHDNIKRRFIKLPNTYLALLGISTFEGKIAPQMEDKFRQINRFIEIIDSVLNEANIGKNVVVNDMGSGKGYLTFALYDYLTNYRKISAEITGVELRDALVEQCRQISERVGFDKLNFVKGYIGGISLNRADLLIALHACDTATDDAIFEGIKTKAGIIICAPCCHKQIRKQLNPINAISNITAYGLTAERQAEILTDTLRALFLEAYGYKTKMLEFISSEHTPKNLMIIGVLNKQKSTPDTTIIEKINDLKTVFGISEFKLEQLLSGKPDKLT